MGMMGCTNTSFSGFASGNSTTHPDIGYFYYNYTQESGAGDFPSGQGLIECHATVSTGYAFLRGDNKTFSSFVPAPFFDSATSNLGGEPLSHPLYAAWDGLLRVALSTGNYDSEARIQGFGIRAQDNSSELGTVIYSFPSEDIVAQRLWSAIAHNTAGIATLSWSNNTAYDATTTSLVSAYVRVQPYAKIAYVLLGHWFALLCLVTVFGYRKSFARSLDGYVAASLVVKGGSELVVDQPYGSSDSNPLLMERFTPERLF
ncbi:hypothetical protein VKT23_008872 [Stygiomarasmius scandens]|uniref:Uncharacterized protein n=1 Tax=Marasmiellus scandens TaxID=2682957 RepID=A0ABR1JLX4_9AGAR